MCHPVSFYIVYQKVEDSGSAAATKANARAEAAEAAGLEVVTLPSSKSITLLELVIESRV